MIQLIDAPETWSKVALGDLFDVKGGVPTPQLDEAFNGGTIPFVKMKDLGRYHLTENLCEVGQFLNPAFGKKQYELIPKGSILMPRSGSVALNHRAILGMDAVIVSHICALVPKNQSFSCEFAYRLLCTVDMRKLTKKTTGLDSIAFSDIKQIEIPLPPIEEQKRLAAILDRADELRRVRQSTLERLGELAQSLFLELFGDPAMNPKGWDVVRLGEAVQFRTGKLDSNAAVVDGAYPFFTCSREDFRINEYAFDCEALLLAGNNASADYSVKHYKGKFNAYQRTYVIELLDPNNSYDYMRHVLERKLQEMKRMSKGTNTKYLTLGILKNLSILLPPIPLQQEFAEQIEELETVKSRARASLTELDALFASLQARAFSGELSGAA